jgi:hypothetical protein
MTRVLTNAAEATPEWLTEALTRSEALSGKRVIRVEADANPAFNSSVTHLTLVYDENAPASAPRRLVLKLNRDHWGEAEVGVYALAMAAEEPVPALVPCFDAAYDARTGESHCLLLEVSETHAAPVTRERVLALDAVLPEAQLEAIVDALAVFHARWWEPAGFGEGVLQPPTSFRDEAACAERIGQRREQFGRFVETAGPTVEPAVLRLCERALARLPALWGDRYLRRFAGGKRVTLVNGDCYFTQFLCPRDGSGEPTYLVDFQEASVHLPAEDLVFLFATFWTREQRLEGDREMRLLRRYLARLEDHGIAGYGMEQLLDDYRVSIVYQLFRTVWDQTSGASEAYWRPKLACVVAAYEDHGCHSLFA